MITLGQVTEGTQQKLAAKAVAPGTLAKRMSRRWRLGLVRGWPVVTGKCDKADSWIYLNETANSPKA